MPAPDDARSDPQAAQPAGAAPPATRATHTPTLLLHARQIAPTRRDLGRAPVAQPADQLDLPTLRRPPEHGQLEPSKLARTVHQTHTLRQRRDEMSSTTPALRRW